MLYCTVSFFIVLHCVVVLYCAVLYCIVLYYIVSISNDSSRPFYSIRPDMAQPSGAGPGTSSIRYQPLYRSQEGAEVQLERKWKAYFGGRCRPVFSLSHCNYNIYNI